MQNHSTLLRLLIVGDTARREFERVVHSVETIARLHTSTVHRLKRIDPETLRDNINYDIAFFLESYPDEYSEQAVEQIRNMNPLAVIVFICGSLCAGEQRTGSLPAGIIRLYSHQWGDFAEQQLKLFFDRRTGFFSQPRTASPYENPFPAMPARSPKENENIFILKMADKAHEDFWRDTLAESNRVLAGTLAELLTLPEPPDRVMIDVVDLSEPTLFEWIKRIRSCFATTEIEIFAFSPYWEEIEQFTSLEHCRVISKP